MPALLVGRTNSNNKNYTWMRQSGHTTVLKMSPEIHAKAVVILDTWLGKLDDKEYGPTYTITDVEAAWAARTKKARNNSGGKGTKAAAVAMHPSTPVGVKYCLANDETTVTLTLADLASLTSLHVYIVNRVLASDLNYRNGISIPKSDYLSQKMLKELSIIEMNKSMFSKPEVQAALAGKTVIVSERFDRSVIQDLCKELPSYEETKQVALFNTVLGEIFGFAPKNSAFRQYFKKVGDEVCGIYKTFSTNESKELLAKVPLTILRKIACISTAPYDIDLGTPLTQADIKCLYQIVNKYIKEHQL